MGLLDRFRNASNAERQRAEFEQLTRHCFAELLDNLRALVSESAVPKIVIAGVSGTEPVENITAGAVAEAEERGLDLVTGELVARFEHRVLRRHDDTANGPEPLKLSGNPPPAVTRRWLEEAATGHDFLLVEGPPLEKSVESALLARYCDGLVILVEVDVTPRLVLQAAVQRAEAAGCTLLGLVMTGTPNAQPYWLRKLLPRTIL